MSPGIFLIRADGSAITGTGHVMRCLALAQAWQDAGGTAIAALAETTKSVNERLHQEGIEVVPMDAAPGSEDDARSTSTIARERQAAWVVIDGYRFDSAYQRSLKESGLRVLAIDDDLHTDYYSTDFVLNQNAHATESLYENKRDANTRLLLGPRYAMLRREFERWRTWQREILPVGRRVLITMGGSDPDNFTFRVLDALRLAEVEELDVTVVVGGSNPHAEAVERTAAGLNAVSTVKVIRNATNIAELMSQADVAVSAAGTTCWEMCLLGLPALVVDIAENQIPVARQLDELGVARHIGSSANCGAKTIAVELTGLLQSTQTRRKMSVRGRELVDGRGAERVCTALLSGRIRVRRAAESDCQLLFEWANEPGVRSGSFSQNQIGWDEHFAWFRSKFAQENCMIFIGELDNGCPMGQVRFDRLSAGGAEIDISIARDFRGAGYGSLLIDAAVQELFQEHAVESVSAFIRPENAASIRAFEGAGFRAAGSKQVRGTAALHYVRGRIQNANQARSTRQ